jgi:hypothetical protein
VNTAVIAPEVTGIVIVLDDTDAAVQTPPLVKSPVQVVVPPAPTVTVAN